MEIILLFVGLAVGAAAGWMARNAQVKSLHKQMEETRLQAKADRDEALAQLKESHREALERADRLSSEALAEQKRNSEAALAQQKRNSEETLAEQKRNSEQALETVQQRFDQTVAKMQSDLQLATSRMLKQREEEFALSSRTSVSGLLQPLEKTIEEMRKAVVENTARHAQFGGQLAEGLRNVLDHSEMARQSAEKLAGALRKSNTVQGDWGERVLAELLTMQGLTEGVHFETQFMLRDELGNALKSEDDRKMKPDVVLHLDQQRDVIIDSKVSLSAFLDYMNAETEETRQAALGAHVLSIEKHVKELVRKNYAAYIKPPRVSVGYVIMFVPNTSALYLATGNRPGLWRRAMEQGVYIADEQTLYAALKIIDLTWRQIIQAENHEKVYSLAGEMLDRVNSFMEAYVKIGNQLEAAAKSYDDGMKKLKEGGQSIPTTCGKLIKLGARHSKTPKGVSKDLLGLDQ